MDKLTQNKLIEAFTTDRHNLIKSKQEDYATDTDVLSNFRGVAIAGGRHMSNVILDECHKKVLRLQNLLQGGKTPNNESIIDSVKDLSNYSDLLMCALSETIADNITITTEVRPAKTLFDLITELTNASIFKVGDYTIKQGNGEYIITCDDKVAYIKYGSKKLDSDTFAGLREGVLVRLIHDRLSNLDFGRHHWIRSYLINVVWDRKRNMHTYDIKRDNSALTIYSSTGVTFSMDESFNLEDLYTCTRD